jgi:hypothetical protein
MILTHTFCAAHTSGGTWPALQLLARCIGLAAGLIGVGLALATPARADELSADEIMQRVYDRDDGDNSSSDVAMTLIDGAGARRERLLRAFSRDFGADTRQLLFFLSPADVEDIGFLTFDYAGIERDDDQWLYLPALGKVKRIATADQSGKFLGTDFSFADLTERENDEYTYTMEAENDPVRDAPAWRILAMPKPREIERTGYTQSRIWVLKESFVVVRAIHSVREGDRKKYYDVSRLELVDGIWSPLEMSMTTKLRDNTTDHRTIVRISNLRYAQGHAPELFTTRQLEKGP